MSKNVQQKLISIAMGACVVIDAIVVLAALLCKGNSARVNTLVATTVLVVAILLTAWRLIILWNDRLTSLEIIADHSGFPQFVAFKSAKVFENEIDVTEQYNIIENDDQVVAIRKDPAAAPKHGHVALKVTYALSAGDPIAVSPADGGSESNITSQVTMDLPNRPSIKLATMLCSLVLVLSVVAIAISVIAA